MRLTLHQGMCSLLRWQTHRQQSCYEAIFPFTFHLPQVRLSFVLVPDTACLFGTDGVALSALQLPSRWPSSFGRTCKAIVCLYCPDHLPLPTVDVATRTEPMFTFAPQALSARGRLHVLKKTVLRGELANTNPSCDSSAPIVVLLEKVSPFFVLHPGTLLSVAKYNHCHVAFSFGCVFFLRFILGMQGLQR